MKLSKEDPIIIIGAGLSGLAAAFSLQFHGYSHVKVYESLEKPEGNSIPLLLGAFHQSSLLDFEVDQWYSRMGKTWKRWTLCWKNGSELAEKDLEDIRKATGYMPRAVAGPEIYDFFHSRLKPDTVISGHTFISFTPQSNHVEVHFDGGITQEAALLVGADGLHSRVRLQLLGDLEADETAYISYKALVEKTALHPLDLAPLLVPYKEYIGPGQSFSLFEVDDKRVGIELTVKKINLTENALSETIAALYQDWETPIPDILRAVPSSVWKSYRAYTIPPSRKWHLNRVMLLGNAVHSTLPHLSLSADMAIESGLLLGKMLNDNRKNLDRALKKFEKRRKKRTKLAYRMSKRRLNLLDWENPVTYTIRNWWIKQHSSHRFYKRYLKLNSSNYLGE